VCFIPIHWVHYRLMIHINETGLPQIMYAVFVYDFNFFKLFKSTPCLVCVKETGSSQILAGLPHIMQAVFVYDFEVFKASPGLLCVKRDRNLASSSCCCCHQIEAGFSHIVQAVLIDTSHCSIQLRVSYV